MSFTILPSTTILIFFITLGTLVAVIAPFTFFTITTFAIHTTVSPQPVTAIVFGASAYTDGPSQVLRDRLDTAYQLYKDGKAKYILVSGDNSTSHYNEPKVMQQYLVDRGVPSKIIYYDFAGLRTYDTCWRAKNVFGVERAYLVTQSRHLPRASFLCKSVGIAVVPISAPDTSKDVQIKGIIREIGAAWLALFDSINGKVQYQSGGTETIVPRD